jgi:hypothetical protein
MLVTFDTLEYVKELKEGGFTDKQADSLAKAQKKVIEAMDKTLATKSDIHEIKNILKEDIHEVIDHIKDFKSELQIECESIKARLAILEKAVWIVIAGMVTLLLKSFFFA